MDGWHNRQWLRGLPYGWGVHRYRQNARNALLNVVRDGYYLFTGLVAWQGVGKSRAVAGLCDVHASPRVHASSLLARLAHRRRTASQ